MTENTKPALGISFQCEVGQGRQIVFQTHMDSEAPLPWINAILDKLNAAVERQTAKIAVEQLEHQRNLRKATLTTLQADYSMIEARKVKDRDTWVSEGRRGPYKESDKELTHKQQMKNALERAEAEVKEFERMLEEAKQKAA